MAAVAEQLAMSLSAAGLQRMHARVLAAFLFSDDDTLTAHRLAEQLGASAGSISAAITMLRTVALIEQVPVPGSRRDHFRLRPGAWATLMTSQNAIIEVMCEVGDRGLAVVAPDSPAHTRLREMRDFYTFLLAELPVLLDRWRARRADPGRTDPGR
ncbi:MarR family transcriptional regulator [Actinomycetes bacterium KLBMP 9759]